MTNGTSTNRPPEQQNPAPSTPPTYTPPPTAYGQGAPPAMPSGAEMVNTFQRFSLGRRVLLGAGVLSWLLFMTSWYKFSVLGTSVSISGLFQLNYIAWLLLAAFVVAMALPLLRRNVKQFVPLPYSEGQIAFFGSAGITVITLLSGLITKPSSYSLSFWFFLTIICLAGMTAGGWLMHQARE